MRTDSRSRLGRAAAAIAAGLVAVAGVASTAVAQNWNGYNSGYYHYPQYNNAPYNSPYSNRGWTWGERYGAPPNAYYSYSRPGYYAQQPTYPQTYGPQTYGSNPQAALGQIMGLFAR
jgi:hypothetical protein